MFQLIRVLSLAALTAVGFAVTYATASAESAKADFSTPLPDEVTDGRLEVCHSYRRAISRRACVRQMSEKRGDVENN
jgi:hypothetical protein